MLQRSNFFVKRNRSSIALSFTLILVLVVGAVTLLAPVDALAKKPGGGGGPCGQCPCPDFGPDCFLESCHLLFGPPDCLWDCHYVCPFPF